MKRILVYGMTDNPGGIETYLINLAKRLSGKVIFDYITDFPDIAYKARIESSGGRIYYIPAKSKGVFAHLSAFYRVLKENPEYDTVYFNILDAGAAVTAFIPFVMGKKIVTHSHNGNTDKKALHKLCRPFLKLFTQRRVACSLLAASYMFGGEKNVTVIPNAIDTDKFIFDEKLRKEKQKELGIEGKTVICHIGRLSNQKNPFGLLDIFSDVLKQKKEAVLLSVGTGEMEQEVHEYAEKIGVGKNVLFLGVREDIPELLFASDVFLLPSFYEGLPIVALEAQAAGLPLILSDKITKETDITSTVEFLSLDDNKAIWTSCILSAAGKRYDNTEKIISAGFDINHTEQADRKILEILGG